METPSAMDFISTTPSFTASQGAPSFRKEVSDVSRILSPLECSTYRGPEKTLERSNYLLFNPIGDPGCTVVAGSCAAHESIGSQVACGLALEHFSASLAESFSERSGGTENADFGLQVLESAFRDANRQVYSFGHSLAAGGRMAAVFIALIALQDENGDGAFCVGRVGNGGAYLYRDNELFPFFDGERSEQELHGNYLGANSLVSVDLAHVPLEEGDRVYLFSEPLDAAGTHELRALAEEISSSVSQNPAEEISRFLFEQPAALGFSFALHVGEKHLFLSRNTQHSQN